MKIRPASGIVAALLAALVIGCGGSGAETSGLLPSTGSGAESGTGTAGGPDTVTRTKIVDADLRFSDTTETNARTTRITRFSDISGVGYTDKGAYLHLVQDVSDGETRAFSLDVPVEFVEGATYTYVPSTDDTPIVVDYDEGHDSGEGATKTWHAASGGTVTVTAASRGSVTLRFEGLRFSEGGEEGNAAKGSFTVSGTLRLQDVEEPASATGGLLALAHGTR